jgi:hypothetical protein
MEKDDIQTRRVLFEKRDLYQRAFSNAKKELDIFINNNSTICEPVNRDVPCFSSSFEQPSVSRAFSLTTENVIEYKQLTDKVRDTHKEFQLYLLEKYKKSVTF